jgi:hypothetical protein
MASAIFFYCSEWTSIGFLASDGRFLSCLMILLKIVSVAVGVIMYGELERVGVKRVLAYFKVCCVYIMDHIVWTPIQNSHSSF